MTGTTDFVIGAKAQCADGDCGHVSRMIVDPIDRSVTHLVIQPAHWSGLGRLVPLDLVDGVQGDGVQGDGVQGGGTATAGGEIRLRCSRAEFERLDCAEETHFLPGTDGYAAEDPDSVLAWPHYGLGGPLGIGVGTADPAADLITYDAVPPGEIEIRRGDHVYATDGPIGRVQGLVIDTGSRHVTHVLLQEGHLWGHKEVAIPISAVTGTEDGIKLGLARSEVRDLPPVSLARPDAG
jgi:sporulation protein YlmC with PRC-barrel domain